MATAAVGQTGSGRGGTSGSPGSASGGSLGTSAGAPGTNSAGTAAPSGQTTGLGNGSRPALGTGNPEADKEDRQVGEKIKTFAGSAEPARAICPITDIAIRSARRREGEWAIQFSRDPRPGRCFCGRSKAPLLRRHIAK
jgi:hypothetical protein